MENKCYLAIMTKPNNYFPINLLDLKISNNYTSTDLEWLDNFTLKFTEKEIKEAIKEANLLDINELMPLGIIYHEKNEIRWIPALTKDITFNMWQKIKTNYENKSFRNEIYNFLNNKTPDVLIELKNSKDLNEFLSIISNLPYIIKRKLYFYLYEK